MRVDALLPRTSSAPHWLSQVAHVVAKDVERLRWIALIYVAGVAVNAVFVVGVLGRLDRGISLGAVPLWVIAVAIVMIVIHEDSPSATGAQWRTLPLNRSAVVVAKLASIVIMPFALSLAGDLAVFVGRGSSPDEQRRFIASAALSTAYVLSGTVVLAGLVGNARQFIAALLLIPVGTSLGAAALSPFIRSVSAAFDLGSLDFVLHLSPAIAVCVLAWLYRERRSLTGKGAAVVTLACTLSVASVLAAKPSTPASGRLPLAVVDGRTVGIEEMRLGSASDNVTGDGMIPIVLKVDTAAPGRFALHSLRGFLSRAGMTETITPDGTISGS
jgi:hypothetical protein